jgi:beta-lactamase regulating signal transducer with metallopeptidase domain
VRMNCLLLLVFTFQMRVRVVFEAIISQTIVFLRPISLLLNFVDSHSITAGGSAVI